MKKYYLILVLACVVLLSFGCESLNRRNEPDLSKIVLKKFYAKNVDFEDFLGSLQFTVNKKLSKDNHIKFYVQANPDAPLEKLRFDVSGTSENYTIKLFDVENKVYYDELQKITSLPGRIDFYENTVCLKDIIEYLCKKFRLKYKQEGNQILLYNPLAIKSAKELRKDDSPMDLTYDGDFHKTIEKADRIVVRAGGYKCCGRVVDNDVIIYETRDAREIKKVYDNINFKIEELNSDCMCCGYPGIDWYKGKKRIALTALKHGEQLKGSGYNKLTKKSQKWLKAWLAKRGVKTEAPRLNIKKQKKTWENASVKPVYFNQTLLKECIPYLSKISGVEIELMKRLKQKNDLAVDLHLDTSKEYYLRGVLYMMIEFIEKEHGIKIKINPVSDKHIVLDLNLAEDKQ